MQIWHCQEKRSLIIIFPACLNFMNCTVSFCRYFVCTGSIFTTGVRLVPSMEHRRTVSGAEGVPRFRNDRSAGRFSVDAGVRHFCTADLQQFTASEGASCRSKVQCALSAVFRTGRRAQNGVIVHSDLLLNYLRTYVPGSLFCFIDDKGADRF